jgi:hypothetical protein
MTHLSEGLESVSQGGRLQIRACTPAQVVSQVVIGDPSASRFTFAYPATRKSANRIDIKITITPVAKTNRSANKRRMGSL